MRLTNLGIRRLWLIAATFVVILAVGGWWVEFHRDWREFSFTKNLKPVQDGLLGYSFHGKGRGVSEHRLYEVNASREQVEAKCRQELLGSGFRQVDHEFIGPIWVNDLGESVEFVSGRAPLKLWNGDHDVAWTTIIVGHKAPNTIRTRIWNFFD